MTRTTRTFFITTPGGEEVVASSKLISDCMCHGSREKAREKEKNSHSFQLVCEFMDQRPKVFLDEGEINGWKWETEEYEEVYGLHEGQSCDRSWNSGRLGNLHYSDRPDKLTLIRPRKSSLNN